MRGCWKILNLMFSQILESWLGWDLFSTSCIWKLDTCKNPILLKTNKINYSIIIWIIQRFILFISALPAAPENIVMHWLSDSSMSVRWSPPPRPHRYGDISGYVVSIFTLIYQLLILILSLPWQIKSYKMSSRKTAALPTAKPFPAVWGGVYVSPIIGLTDHLRASNRNFCSQR